MGAFLLFVSRADGRPKGAVRTIAQDASGDLWFGIAGSGGLVRRHNDRFEVFTRRHGLVHNSIRCLHADVDGTLWIGTERGLSRWREGRFVNFRDEDGLSNGRIVAIVDELERRGLVARRRNPEDRRGQRQANLPAEREVKSNGRNHFSDNF